MPVYLIGAGPGDPGLLTCRGKDLVARADVVIYDYLAAERLLALARPDAELIYVGKKAGNHTLPQAQINSLLAEKAQAGNRVARLKGGDPYIFGRGGEEAEYLVQRGIPFEVVPGVSSTIAAPAYAGIPLTHRGFASSLTIITGHEDPDKANSAHDWDALARSGSTLVFVMGVKNLELIAKNLIQAGMPPSMPAAIIEWGTTNKQRTLVADLSHLPEKAGAENYHSPALIVVGQVVSLRDRLNWFEQRPLFGKTILVTRSREQIGAQSQQLEDLGATVIECPCLRVAPIAENPELDTAIGQLSAYDWLIFTSQNAVSFFFERLAQHKLDARALAGVRLASIGAATSAALRGHGLQPDLQAPEFTAEKLAEALIAQNISGKNILLPQAAAARPVLAQMLREAKASVNAVALYTTRPDPNLNPHSKQALQAGQVDCISFACSSSVDNFFAGLGQDLAQAPRKPVLACIGPITAARLADFGYPTDIQPATATIPALCATIADYYKDKL